MQYRMRLAFLASVSLIIMAIGPAASAYTVTTPYNPSDPTDLSSFGNGNELAAQTVTYVADPNGKGLDIKVQVDPTAGDMADKSLGDQFTNLYFGDTTNGATIGFELSATNEDAFVPGVAGNTPIGSSAGITFVDTPGTSDANGGVGSISMTYIPYVDFTTNVLGLSGFTPYSVGDSLQLRDIQAFSYGGNNAGGGARFGSNVLLAAVPEPATWAMMLLGAGFIGGTIRSRRGVMAAA